MLGIIIIIYLACGMIAAWLHLIITYRDSGEVVSDDIAIALVLFLLGVLGLLIIIGDIVHKFIEENKPVEGFLEKMADSVTRFFDKFRRNEE